MPPSARGWPTGCARRHVPAASSRWTARLRGSARDGHQVHLLAALDHHDGAVLAQRQVDGAPGEVPAFQPLLAGLDLAGVVVTADALHTQRDHASFLVGRGADYLLVVKANQPTLGFQGRYRVSVDASSIAVFRWIVDQYCGRTLGWPRSRYGRRRR